MMRSNLFTLCIALALTACNDETVKAPTNAVTPQPKPTPAIVGGYHPINPQQDSNTIQIEKFLSREIAAKAGKSIAVEKTLDAYSQVVAGTNYRLTVQMTDGSVYESVVFLSLQNVMSLTSLNQLSKSKR